jgi:hypothetical protein
VRNSILPRKVGLSIRGEEVVLTLLDEKAPKLCEFFWSVLPFDTLAHHAKICNHEIIAPIPVPINIENENLVLPVAGDLSLWDQRDSINLWYADPGPSGPLGTTALIARVTENLKGLEKEGMKLWKKQGTKLRFYRL